MIGSSVKDFGSFCEKPLEAILYKDSSLIYKFEKEAITNWHKVIAFYKMVEHKKHKQKRGIQQSKFRCAWQQVACQYVLDFSNVLKPFKLQISKISNVKIRLPNVKLSNLLSTKKIQQNIYQSWKFSNFLVDKIMSRSHSK